ncbi:MAG: T9SS type A sorting domain-containing protein [Ignavibacteriaceae bacterium]
MRLLATITFILVVTSGVLFSQEDTYAPRFKSDGSILVVYDSTSGNGRVSRDSVVRYFDYFNVSYELFNKGNELFPNIRSFRGFKMIIWLGAGTSVISNPQKDSLKAYLNNPTTEKSKLIIIAEDVGYTLGDMTSPSYDLDFCNNYLDINYLRDRPFTGSSQTLTWVHMPEVTSHKDSTIGFWPDVLQLYNPFLGNDLIKYNDGTSNGIGKISTNYNTAVFGVDLESMRPSYFSPQGSAQRRLLYWAMMYVEYDGVIFSDEINQLAWYSTLQIKNSLNLGGNLNFGMAASATDNIDIALGESPLGAVPPASNYDARFELPTVPAVYSAKDYRDSELGEVIWKVYFQPGSPGYPITFSWTSWVLPVGEFRLRNNASGTIVNVDMKSDSVYVLTNTGVTSLEIYYQKEICGNINIAGGWNIVSVPVNAPDMRKITLFSAATSPLYGFNNGYQSIDTARIGSGYWIRFGSGTVLNVCGTQAESNSVAIKSGWNLIGIYNQNIIVSGITTTPSGILTSPFYQYSNGYQPATTLEVGRGFWIRCSTDGVINLNTKLSEKTISEDYFATNYSELSRITVTDKNKNQAFLYIDNEKANLSLYDLPPMPPEGIFDVRFSSDRVAENLKAGMKEIRINSAIYPIEIKTEAEVKVKVERGLESEERILRNGESIQVSEGSRIFVESVETPAEFSLSQNYPNPFNPTTAVSYQIPVSGKVTLKIFDVLGKEVATLVNKEAEAGSYHAEFNASGISSGVYFYELQAGGFRSVKKMILVR